MSERKKTRSEIVSEMTDIICSHLEKMPAAERKSRIKAFGEAINRGGKRSSARPKAASVSRTRRKSQRIPA